MFPYLQGTKDQEDDDEEVVEYEDDRGNSTGAELVEVSGPLNGLMWCLVFLSHHLRTSRSFKKISYADADRVDVSWCLHAVQCLPLVFPYRDAHSMSVMGLHGDVSRMCILHFIHCVKY